MISSASAQDLSNTVWALSALSMQDFTLLHAISAQALLTLSQFTSQNLANTAWAFATQKFLDEPLLDAIAAAALRTMSAFGAQALSNLAWAFSTLVLVHQPLFDALAACSLANIDQFDSQGLANTSWSFAVMFCSPEPLLDSIAAQAILSIEELDPQNCANIVWSYALLVVCNKPLLESISARAIKTIHQYSCQSLANTAWSFANFQIMNIPLLNAIAGAARTMLSDLNLVGWSRADLISFAYGLLGIAWAHAFLAVHPTQLDDMLPSTLRIIGLEVDRQIGALSLPEIEREATEGIRAKEPRLEMELRGIIVIHKQPDWEVDGKARAEKDADEMLVDEKPPALSRWLRSALSCSLHPLTRLPELDFGFLHRLDVPSSGLILCGTTFTGLLGLRLQLDTYLIERQYIVWGHGLADVSLRQVVANIDPRTVDSRRSFVSDANGKPATSWFTIPAHFRIPSLHGPLLSYEPCSCFIIRIRTGRRHQIRAHMLYAGHPTVVDAKYAATEIVLHGFDLGRTTSEHD